MPNFFNNFASSIKERQNYLKEKIITGYSGPLDRKFHELFSSLWISINPKPSGDSLRHEVLAVDSSVYRSLLSTGGIFYIVRSLAVHRRDSWKKLETDIVFTKKGLSHISQFISLKMELLEFEVATDALESGLKVDAVLIDGSLYGRVAHLPIEFKVEKESDLMVRYFQAYSRLLNLCKVKNVLLMGISKESRSTFFRDYILSLIFNKELEEANLPTEVTSKLQRIFSGVLDDENVAFQEFEDLRQKFRDIPQIFEHIFRELASSRPDHQLIMNLASDTGYTRPLLLGPSARMLRRLNELRSNPKAYVRKYFPKVTRERGDEFADSAANVLSSILDMPSFLSLHIVLDPRDSPIRVDIPFWEYRLCDILWPSPAESYKALDEGLEILKEGYGGLVCHNLWLKDVDEKVRLKREVVDEIYFPYLEKLFQVKIIRGRGYRRVKYP